MSETDPASTAPVFATLGPEATDHVRITRRYMEFQGLLDGSVELMQDPISEGPDWVLGHLNRFLIICSAHPRIHIVNERYPQDVVVVDTFAGATRPLSLVARKDAEEPRRLGLVAATRGYIHDLEKMEKEGIEVVDVQSKPVLSEMLLRGEVDAGVTYTALAESHPDLFVVEDDYGPVNTTWVVFGNSERSPYDGDVMGLKMPWVFTGEDPPAGGLTALTAPDG